MNEGQDIGDCVRSVRAAAEKVDACATFLLVADRCTDDTVARARRAWGVSGLTVAEVDAGSAGRARHLGATLALDELRDDELRHAWIATTDADTTVPESWLRDQLALAAEGFDGVAGTIDLRDWDELAPPARERYLAMLRRARRADGQHADVFAANLGVRASALRDCGGFPDVHVGEDHALWDALVRSGRRVTAPAFVKVVTSARLTGRARGGLADLLASLSVASVGSAPDGRPQSAADRRQLSATKSGSTRWTAGVSWSEASSREWTVAPSSG